MYWQGIGFGLTVGWLWLFFLGGPVLAALVQPWPRIGEICFQLFLLVTALSYLAVGRRIGPASLLAKKRLLLGAALLMSLSTGLAGFLLARAGAGSPLTLAIYPLAAAGGLGSAVFMLAWQETFTALSIKEACLSFAGGIALASLLLFAGKLLAASLGAIATVLLPLPALYLLRKHPAAAPPSPSPPPAAQPDGPLRRPYPTKLILLIVLFYAAGGSMYKLAGLKYAYADLFWLSNLSYLAVVAVAAGILHFAPDLDLRLLYRPVLPLLAAGFVLFPFLAGARSFVSFLLLQAGFALFDMYTWLLIVYIARGSSRPVPVMGLGMFWITISICGGNLAFSAIAPLIPVQRRPDSLAVLAGLVALLASLVFQDKKETFAGWAMGAPAVRMGDDPKAGRDRPSECGRVVAGRQLTPREAEILALLLKGRNNPFISERLNISPNTLKFHLRNIYQKFAVGDRQELLDLLERDEAKA